jgi:hypothetical protein
MPTWGDRYVDYLLTFGLATLLSPNNLPGLPNLGRSEFVFITTEQDGQRIRGSKLFGMLEAIIPVKFLYLTLVEGRRREALSQLATAMEAGANEALGKGFCFLLNPDGIYSDGMLRFPLWRGPERQEGLCLARVL